MNRTTKAKYDLAERMLNVHIEPAEVAIMSDLPLEEVEKLKANLMKNSDTGGTTVQDYMAELATEAKSQLEAQNKNKQSKKSTINVKTIIKYGKSQ